MRTLPPFPFRVVIVDESAEGPARLRRLLGDTIDVVVVTSASALDDALLVHVDLLVVEHRLTWGDSLSVIARALSQVATLAIIVLTDSGNERLAVAALRAGACNYLRKATPDERLREALHETLSPWNSGAADDPNGAPALLEAVNVGVVRSLPDGRLIDANPALARMAGLTDADALAAWNTPRFYQSLADRQRWLATMDEEGVLKRIGQMQRSDGTPVLAETYARAVKHADGHTLFYEGHLRDVTEREGLRERVAFQASLLDHVRHAVSATDNDFRIRYWNRPAEAMYGWTAAEVEGRSVFDVLPTDAHAQAALVHAQARAQGTVEFVAPDPTKDGSTIMTHKWLSRVTGHDGTPIGVLLVAVDVRDLHQRERELQRALADRESLRREIHHRVKNNLQIVSSLLSLQVRRAETPALRAAVRACQVRLRAIGAVHEELYRAPGVASVRISDFLAGMVARLASMGDDVPAVTLGHVVPSTVAVDLATFLGLILTELSLLWTSLEPTRVPPVRLRVDLVVAADDHVLTITDTSGGREQARTSVLAARAQGIIEELTRDLGCVLTFVDGDEPCVSVRFGARVS